MMIEFTTRHKNLAIFLLAMVLAHMSSKLHAQFVEIDITLPPRFEMRIISPEKLRADHPELSGWSTSPGDDSLLPEGLLWLEIGSVENLELLMDAHGEHPVYYINTGVFDTDQALPLIVSTAIRLSESGQPNSATRLYRVWIGIRPEEKGLININYN